MHLFEFNMGEEFVYRRIPFVRSSGFTTTLDANLTPHFQQLITHTRRLCQNPLYESLITLARANYLGPVLGLILLSYPINIRHKATCLRRSNSSVGPAPERQSISSCLTQKLRQHKSQRMPLCSADPASNLPSFPRSDHHWLESGDKRGE